MRSTSKRELLKWAEECLLSKKARRLVIAVRPRPETGVVAAEVDEKEVADEIVSDPKLLQRRCRRMRVRASNAAGCVERVRASRERRKREGEVEGQKMRVFIQIAFVLLLSPLESNCTPNANHPRPLVLVLALRGRRPERARSSPWFW